MDKKQNVTEEIKIEGNKEKLKKYFPNCFDKEGNFNLKKFEEEIKINEMNLSKESYSLEWLGKSYARVLTFESARTLLKEDEEWNNKEENKNSGNILIKGDNLEVLKHIVNAYNEKIKMIYIDPPYNRGNDDFVYRDDRKFTVEELAELAGIDEERAKRILDFVNSKSNSHSAWLTFMYPRLYIARRLLREDGVIFVSIDDNEVAQLKILMDEIFGEENFVAQFPWRKRTAKSDVPFGVSQDFEWVLTYAKSELFKARIKGKQRKYYETDDLPGRPWRIHEMTTHRTAGERPNSFFTIVNPKTGEKYPADPNNVWRITKETFEVYLKENRIVFPSDYDFLKISKPVLRYFKEDDMKKDGENFGYVVVSTHFPPDIGMTLNGTKEIFELFKAKIFSFPKPTSLLKFLVNISCKKNDIILDLFAGSGTTGDAVMQLNAEDGGNRKYILVQLPEPIDPKKNRTTYDFVKNELGIKEPTIFEITKERLVRAAKKIRENNVDRPAMKKEIECEGIDGEHCPACKGKYTIKIPEQKARDLSKVDLGFKIFETIPIWEDYLADEKELTEQTTLFDVSKLTDEDLKALLITWKTYDGLPLTEDCEGVKLNDYTAYHCGANLYLLHSNWKTENIKALLERIDSDKDFVVDKIIVFGYNFTSKHLREIEENVRNYSNKKRIEIETVLRF